MLLWWANKSLPPSSGVMNPKPLESLNHFTLPVVIYFPFLSLVTRRIRAPLRARCSREELTATTGAAAFNRAVGEEWTDTSLLEILRDALYHDSLSRDDRQRALQRLHQALELRVLAEKPA